MSAATISAMTCMWRYGAYSRSAIERILTIQATPKTALDSLAEKEQQQLKSLLGDEPVRPRSGKDYQKLLDEQTHKQTHEVGDAANEQEAQDDGEECGEERAESDAAQDSQPFHEAMLHLCQRFGSGGEEVSARAPMLGLSIVHQADVCLMDECGGLKSLAGLFLGHFFRS